MRSLFVLSLALSLASWAGMAVAAPSAAHPLCTCSLCADQSDTRACVLKAYPTAPVDCGTAFEVLGCGASVVTPSLCSAGQESDLLALPPAEDYILCSCRFCAANPAVECQVSPSGLSILCSDWSNWRC